MGILERVEKPSDVKKLNEKEMKLLAEELRGEILSAVNRNGGHLSSNLGIVETTVALYHTFDFPKDKLIFDVGHQCYAHKILSDRKEKFCGIRTLGGISGFPDAEESEFDSFTTGHAGCSIAEGIGLCAARDALNEDYTVINVVGDGAIVNGLNLEAMSASEHKPKNYIVILNDNGMSISKNSNALYKHISKSTMRRGYVGSKNFIKRVFGNSFVTRFFRRFRDFVKRLFGGNNYFEQFGFKYVGVYDGNDIKELTKILKDVKNACRDKAVLLHVKTTKGKGLKSAEERADVYHGVGKNMNLSADGEFSAALGNALCSAMEKDEKIFAITAAMKDGTGLSAVEKAYPARFCDVGIAEEYAVTFAAGLARGGLKPVVAIYSTFMQRAYDEILHDVCLQNLPVVFCMDRAGLVGEDGKTHQGVFDLSFLSHIPNITVLAPESVSDLPYALKYAFSLSSPVAIRYPKKGGSDRGGADYNEQPWLKRRDGADAAIFAAGARVLDFAMSAAERFERERGIKIAVFSARTVKPLCESVLNEFIGKKVFTVEENSVIGGFGAAVAEYYAAHGGNTPVKVLGIKDEFIPHGSVKEQLSLCGLDEEGIYSSISREF